MGKTKRKVRTKLSVEQVHEFQTKFYKRNTTIEPKRFKKPKYKSNWSSES